MFLSPCTAKSTGLTFFSFPSQPEHKAFNTIFKTHQCHHNNTPVLFCLQVFSWLTSKPFTVSSPDSASTLRQHSIYPAEDSTSTWKHHSPLHITLQVQLFSSIFDVAIIQAYSSGNLLFSLSLPWELSNQAAHLEMAHRTHPAPGVSKHSQQWHRNHRSNQARCSLVLYSVHTVPILNLLQGRLLSSPLHIF